jgi:putative salt-induced outer membrane protein YdiY
VNSLFNTQEDAESSSQSYLSVGATRFRKNRRNVFGLTQVQSNPDQGYNLRWVIGGGAGKFLVERSDMLANVIAGLVYERESITNSDAVDNSAEVLLGIDFGSFKYKQLDRIITMTLNTFTNVTDTPRFRAQLNFKLNWEIVNNFNLGISVLDSYDSRPPTVDAESNDLALTTSVGYSF